jgi:hypothetical protein
MVRRRHHDHRRRRAILRDDDAVVEFEIEDRGLQALEVLRRPRERLEERELLRKIPLGTDGVLRRDAVDRVVARRRNLPGLFEALEAPQDVVGDLLEGRRS